MSIHLEHERVHADDCERCEEENSRIDRIVREVEMTGDLDDKQRKRLVEIADKCPVSRTLRTETVIDTREGRTGESASEGREA